MTASQKVEHVMVVPTELFREIGYFQGFCTEPEPYLRTMLDPAYVSYRPRDEVEEDPGFKQLIPYCIFQHAGRVFHYKRGKLQGEGRLHSKRSIGVGGHISSDDCGESGPRYLEAMHREIAEEVYVDAACVDRCAGLINDDETEVGRVHIGIVHIFDLEAPKVRPREKSIIETGFSLPEELTQHVDQFESWSQICLRHLFAS